MTPESLPAQPIGREEVDWYVEETDGKFMPEVYIETDDRSGAGYVGAIFHRPDGELILGFDREDLEWKVITQMPPTATLTETHNRLVDWAEENYEEYLEGRL